MMQDLVDLTQKVADVLLMQNQVLVTAESCTAGWVSQCVTQVAGSSQFFDRGFVTYTNLAKQEMLGVPDSVLSEFGAVSEPVARAMAEGALKHSQASVAISVTGIAGPDGGSLEKPVGTVWFGFAFKDRPTLAILNHFSGDRCSIRKQSVAFVLTTLISQCS